MEHEEHIRYEMTDCILSVVCFVLTLNPLLYILQKVFHDWIQPYLKTRKNQCDELLLDTVITYVVVFNLRKVRRDEQ